MRILYLHQYFNRPADPGGTRSYEMAKRLVSYGHEVFMITSDHRGLFKSKGWHVTQEAGVEVHWLPVPYNNKMTYPERIKAFFKFAAGSARRAASIPADVVFATSTPLTIAIPGVYTARRQGIPMVFEVRDLWPELPIAMGAVKGPFIYLAKWLESFAYRNSEHIIALSPGMRDGIVKTGYPLSAVSVIPNCCDLDLFDIPAEEGHKFREKYEWLKNRPMVLYAGTLGKINGVSYLAELAAEVQEKNPEIRFLVAGNGAEESKVESKAKELGVYKKSFFMIKAVPKQQITALFSAADLATSLFINLPEMWTNSANKFFDALASGTALAINHQGWQADLLREHGSGIVLPPEPTQTAAQQLVTFLQDKKRIKKAEKAARMLASTKFNRNHLARQLESVLIKAVFDFKEKKSRQST